MELSDRLWEVDVFTGENEGLVIAEVELDHVGQAIQIPSWVGREITSDYRYGNSSLARRPFRRWEEPAVSADAALRGRRAA